MTDSRGELSFTVVRGAEGEQLHTPAAALAERPGEEDTLTEEYKAAMEATKLRAERDRWLIEKGLAPDPDASRPTLIARTMSLQADVHTVGATHDKFVAWAEERLKAQQAELRRLYERVQRLEEEVGLHWAPEVSDDPERRSE